MNPATIQLIIALIPPLTTLIEQIISNIELAKSSGVTEAQLETLVTSVSKLTATATAALNASIASQQANATSTTPAA